MKKLSKTIWLVSKLNASLFDSNVIKHSKNNSPDLEIKLFQQLIFYVKWEKKVRNEDLTCGHYTDAKQLFLYFN